MKDILNLDNQVCFPIYSLAKEMVNHYRPFLDELNITYPQYLVLLVLWEEKEQTVGQIGEKLFLDTGTLTPLLKRMEQKGILMRTRSEKDERVVNLKLTSHGIALKTKALEIPEKLMKSMNVTEQELIALKTIINKILNK